MIKRSFQLLLAAISALPLVACGTLSRMQLDADSRESERFAQSGNLRAEVDSLFQPLIDQGETPGVVVGVLLGDGSRHVFSYGVADKSTGKQPNSKTLFAVGSLSKLFLGEITAQLVLERRMMWNDTLETLLPQEIALSDDAKKITLLQLATHTSGLPRQPMTPRTLGYFFGYLFTGNSFYRHFDKKYILNYLSNFDAPSKVGRQYSNIGYGLLTYIIERRTGTRVDDLLHERVTAPLSLSDTAYTPEGLPDYSNMARGYAGDQPKFIRRGRPVPDWRFTDAMRGAAAMYSNADDLLTFAGVHLNGTDNPALDAAIKESLSLRPTSGTETAAVAWTVEEGAGTKIAYQVGLVGGYTSYIGMDLEHRIAVVVLQNSFNWTMIGHRLLLRVANAQRVVPS
ncbi:MAG: beta-lactamase family protein [Xanthomonadales bacterium]|nr:beta-lactamase family protein [Xanthomonadales bacterium]